MYVCMYVYYIHPELRISNCPSKTGAPGEHWGAVSEQGGPQQKSKSSGSTREPDLAAPYHPAIAARVVYSTSVCPT